MSAIDNLRAADTLRFSGIGYQLNLPLGQGTRSGTATNFCKTKGGGLSLTLTSADLNLPVSNLSLVFTGDANHDGTVVTWTTDTPLNDVSYMGYSITRVHGTIVTSIGAALPMLGAPCGSTSTRLYRALLRTVGTSPTLNIDIDVPVLGGVTATAAVVFQAAIGETVPPTFFTVDVQANGWDQDACRQRYQLVTPKRPPLRATALVQYVQTTGNITSTKFLWKVSPPHLAYIVGSSTDNSVSVRLDAPGNRVVLSVAVTVTTDLAAEGTEVGSLEFAAVTAQELDQFSLTCNLKAAIAMLPNVVLEGAGAGFTAGGIHFVDPLYDPPKGEIDSLVAVRSFNDFELAQIEGASARIIESARAVHAHTRGLREALEDRGRGEAKALVAR